MAFQAVQPLSLCVHCRLFARDWSVPQWSKSWAGNLVLTFVISRSRCCCRGRKTHFVAVAKKTCCVADMVERYKIAKNMLKSSNTRQFPIILLCFTLGCGALPGSFTYFRRVLLRCEREREQGTTSTAEKEHETPAIIYIYCRRRQAKSAQFLLHIHTRQQPSQRLS